MEIARNQRAARRSSRETSAQGGRSQRAEGHEDRARGRAHQKSYTVEEEQEEQHHRQQRGDGPKPSSTNLALHFAELTNAILRGIKVEGTSDKLYDEFMQTSKESIIRDLKRTYNELYDFYNNPSKMMPEWLSESPPAETFYTPNMDGRLLREKSRIKQELRAFVEGLGFVCLEVSHQSCIWNGFEVNLRLDVATVPTKEARKRVKNSLLTLERVSH